jgi:hypothetical protein
VTVPRAVVVTEVIVHLASDGRSPLHPHPNTLTLHLIREDNSSLLVTSRPVVVDCRRSEVRVAVVHNLTTPFVKSMGQ